MPKEITIIWTTEDIRAAYTGLSEEQAEEVLFDLEHNHDSEFGINWTTIEAAMDNLGFTYTRR